MYSLDYRKHVSEHCIIRPDACIIRSSRRMKTLKKHKYLMSSLLKLLSFRQQTMFKPILGRKFAVA
jgi:hypothetical protein